MPGNIACSESQRVGSIKNEKKEKNSGSTATAKTKEKIGINVRPNLEIGQDRV